MGLISVLKCDRCGEKQEDTGLWLLLRMADDGAILTIKRLAMCAPGFSFEPGDQTLCGRECLQKEVETFLARILQP